MLARLPGKMLTPAVSKSLTLPGSQGNHFFFLFCKNLKKKYTTGSDLHALLGQLIVTRACQLLEMIIVIQRQQKRSSPNISVTQTTTTTRQQTRHFQEVHQHLLDRAVSKKLRRASAVYRSWNWGSLFKFPLTFLSKSSKCKWKKNERFMETHLYFSLKSSCTSNQVITQKCNHQTFHYSGACPSRGSASS